MRGYSQGQDGRGLGFSDTERIALRRILPAVFMLAVLAAASSDARAQTTFPDPALESGGSDRLARRADPAPNILFVILDDVGVDQMQAFGYGGDTPPEMPNIDRIAAAGIRFRNVWSMPACSTSRAVIFTGRFPLRTNVLGALGPNDLANSMVSPFELTTPILLAERGYESALFGKFHLALQGHDPAGYAMPYNLGWDYFAGWLDETGDPSSIDVTAGGVAEPGESYSCGFVPSAAAGGADAGACYWADGTCRELTREGVVPPGRICLDQGGILDPDQSCQAPEPDYLNFETLSGHYVSPLVYNFADGSVEQAPPTDPRARRFRAALAVDEAIEWINQRPAGQPWMATVSFASDHTPLVPPPVDESLAGNPESSDLDCSDPAVQRVMSNLMIESLDAEVGRLLVEVGVARRRPGGRLGYRPNRTDTMVVIVGDNGDLGSTVKSPFEATRAKGTAYQTGVWVPLIIAGPLVDHADRAVWHIVNIADLYALFGEIAGIKDVRGAVPRTIDAAPMLPYLLHRRHGPIRKWNFTQIGVNSQANGTVNAPCTIDTSCTQIPVSKSVCEDNDGTWWGEGHDASIADDAPSEGFTYCCQVNAYLVAQGCSSPDCTLPSISPLSAVGIRNRHYKLVQNWVKEYVSQEQQCVDTTVTEFYRIHQAVPVPKLDREGSELPLDALTPAQQRHYDSLMTRLETTLASQPACPGDGNIDSRVDQQDLDDWRIYSEASGLSSVYDLNLDGLTDDADEAIIQENLGLECGPAD